MTLQAKASKKRKWLRRSLGAATVASCRVDDWVRIIIRHGVKPSGEPARCTAFCKR